MIITFGKYEGYELDDLPGHYVEWFLEQDWTKRKYPMVFSKLQSMDKDLCPFKIGIKRLDKLTKYFNDESKKLRSQRRLDDATSLLRELGCEI